MLEMLQNIPFQPLGYHLVLVFLLLLLVEAGSRIGELRWGFAAIVYLTIGMWYFVDIVYRPEDYEKYSSVDINLAFIQVGIFLFAFRLLLEIVPARTRSSVLRQFNPREFANWQTARVVLLCWLTLFIIGMTRANFSLYALFPINSRLEWGAQMWARPRFGSNWSFLISVGDYSYQLACAAFGVIAVSTKSLKIRYGMIGMMLLTWPMFVLSGARHQVIAVAMPTLLSILIMRNWSRGKQIAFLGVTFILTNAIMLAIIEYRNSGFASFSWDNNPVLTKKEKIAKHQGLNMLEELIYLNGYQAEGLMKVEQGGNYFAHAVNFVPRGLWKEKPFPGGDFAVLRVGYHEGQVAATISHGVVGQGVTNFGKWLGPIAPAFLLSLLCAWVCWYPKRGHLFFRIMMVMVTFAALPNFGRDITLFSGWPIVFGVFAIRVYEYQFWRRSQVLSGNSPLRRVESYRSTTR